MGCRGTFAKNNDSCKTCPLAAKCKTGSENPIFQKIKFNTHSCKIFVILSGKGGVGKSTMAYLIAKFYAEQRKKVCLIDFDLTGPSIPRLTKTEDIFLPVENFPYKINDYFSTVSSAYTDRKFDSNQFIFDVLSHNYNAYDYLIIDTPPGIQDEHFALRHLNIDGVILITTPFLLAVADVERQLSFIRKLNLPVKGLIENMNGYRCKNCDHIDNKSNSGKEFCKRVGIQYLGSVHTDQVVGQSIDRGDVDTRIIQEILNNFANF